ncbi:helix-turn-helix domain-containing protein [Mycobacterium marseillense]|uniref:helix-turn-helix domain-containing protein n=1 Tax=Mycobacterium marseillense TaxID=701042 RepID=UPI0011A39693
MADRTDRRDSTRRYPLSGDGFKFEYLRALNGVQLGEPGKPNYYFRVLVALWNYADERGRNAFPTIQQLARDCCTSTRTVDRALEYLISEGWVRQESRGRTGRASVYSLHIPDSIRHGCRASEIEHDTAVTPTRHGCQTNTTPVSIEHDTGDVPIDPVPDHGINHSIDPYGETVAEQTNVEPVSPPSMPLRIVTTQMFHDSPDEFLPDDCTDCKWHGRACGRVREPVLASVGAAEPNWDKPTGQVWTDDEPPF